MPSNKRHDLKSLRLMEVSLVDNPANVDARVALFKRGDMTDDQRKKMKEYMDKGMGEDEARDLVMREMRKDAGASGEPSDSQGDESMDVEKLAEQLESLEKKLTDMTAERDAAVEKLSAIEKQADEPEYVEIDGEKVEKSAVPAPILKRLEAQAERIAKMEADREAEQIAKRGEAELPNLGGTAELKGKLLKAADEIGPEAVALLKGADEAAKRATAEVGYGHFEPESPLDKLDKMAKEYAAKEGVPYGVAYDAVTKSGEGAALFAKRNAH